MPVFTADVVGTGRPDDLGAEKVGLRRASGTRGAADGDDGDGGLHQILGDRGQQRQQRGGRIAAGHGDPGGAAQPVPGAGQLGQSVRPAARVRRSVVPLPRRRVGEPEVGAAVDDHDVGVQLFGERRGVAVRQRQEHHVVPGENIGVGGLEHATAQRQQMRVMLGQRGARARGRRQRPDGQPTIGVAGMTEQ